MTCAARRSRVADTDVSSSLPAQVLDDGLTYDREAALAHLRAASPRLDVLIDAAGPFEVHPEPITDPFAHLLRSIVFQQLNGTAAATIHRRVLSLFDGAVPQPEALLDTSVDALRAAGVSASKAASMHDLAAHAAAGALPTGLQLLTMSDLAIVDRLTDIRGIGPWTVHMLLLFRLGRPDVLPTGDFGVREGHRLLHGLDKQPTPAQLREAAEGWRPYRGAASWYLYRAVDLSRAGQLPSPP